MIWYHLLRGSFDERYSGSKHLQLLSSLPFWSKCRGVLSGSFVVWEMVFIDFDCVNPDKIYDRVDENGVDVRLPALQLNRPFVYKSTRLNEVLVRLQHRATKSYTRLENDLIMATNGYLVIKQASAGVLLVFKNSLTFDRLSGAINE
jgi:hypothetical protein